MPVILLSGFDLFGGCSVNSSWEAVKASAPKLPPGWSLRKVKLPVAWRRCETVLEGAWTPEVTAVIACGMAGIKELHPERIAINLTAPAAKDVDGHLPPSEFVVPGAPPAYFSRLPLKRIHDRLTREQIPVNMSAHCGTYLCNFLFYRIMHNIQSEKLDISAGFIHIPDITVAGAPPLTCLIRGLELAIETTLNKG